MGFPTAVLRWH